ncbi:glutathione S-transferase domain-containing protein [Salinisphaera sp. PC39]|uniref:glutathione S-transferase family protein n=1 Tax=Salinisphaera sp. PC39 TaxID=1304156 RepID=UPI00333FC798
MGLLIEGEWRDRWYDTESTGGRFVRESPGFRHWVTADGSSGFPAEAGRYHLYVSLACPWAHRTLIMRALKGLEEAVGVSVVDPYMGENGWTFSEAPGCIPDTVNGARYLYEVYRKAVPDYTGRVTTPTLWDRERGTIVSNESSDIMRMLNAEFDAVARHPARDYYPADLRERIDAINEPIYHEVNNGVYKAGFATAQDAYEEACRSLFARLDALDERLGGQRYLAGDRLTEADWRLFTTLVRFDAVYHGHFKCNIRRIADYPHLSGYLRELYQVPGIAATTDFDHIKQHYYRSHGHINPTGIVPLGPELDLDAPHGRDARSDR